MKSGEGQPGGKTKFWSHASHAPVELNVWMNEWDRWSRVCVSSWFRFEKWAELFGQTIYAVSAKATALTDLQTVSDNNLSVFSPYVSLSLSLSLCLFRSLWLHF